MAVRCRAKRVSAREPTGSPDGLPTATPQFLEQRHGVYFYRRDVPQAYRQAIGFKVWKISLGTGSRTEAERLARAHAVDHDALLAALMAAFLATALVAYLSLNVVTHSVTLRLQLTHLWPWPSEGTVRVIALGICVASVSATRYLRSAPSSGANDQALVGERVGTPA